MPFDLSFLKYKEKYVIDHDLQFGTSLREIESMEQKLCQIVTQTISVK